MDNKITLCRICLSEGAKFPIFVKLNNEEDIQSKLFICLHEKLEDIEGFPRNICESCNIDLNTICNFINKYKATCKILTKSLSIIKQENLEFNHIDDHSEVEIDFSDIKIEKIDVNENISSELEELFKVKSESAKKLKRESAQKEKSLKKSNVLPKNKTNRIASSLLEGEFTWNGERWCLHSKDPIRKPLKIKKEQLAKKITRHFKNLKNKSDSSEKLCDLCGEVYSNSEKLTLHKKKVHFQKPVKCPHCPRVCCSEYYLGRHLLRKHSDAEKNFICSTCGAQFAFKGELTSHHKNVHEKDLRPKKVYTCKICNKNYKCAKSVVVHERSVHTGLRPAICSLCDSSFYHEDYLKEHMRLHTGETPFKCPICGRGYAQRCNMKSHLRIHRISEIDPLTLSRLRPNYLKLLKKT